MSQGSLGGSARVTPPQHDLGRPRPRSLHDDLCLRTKQPFRFRLLGSGTPDARSVEMVSLDGSRALDSARSSRVLRGGTRCPACQAWRGTQTTSVRTTRSSFRNTQRISFLHSEFGGRKISRDECQDLECNSKAFLDHLLKVEASSSAETPSSSRSHSPKESRKRGKEENGRDSSDGDDGEIEVDAPRAPPPAATQEPAPRRPSRAETPTAPTGEPAEAARPAKTHRHSTTSSHSTSDATSPSDASSGETRDLSTAPPSPSSTESNLSDVGRTEVSLRPKDAHVSSDLLREVSRGIYDRHASWAPWVPDLYPSLHENKADKEDTEDRAIREDERVSEVRQPISEVGAISEDKHINEVKQPISEDKLISEDRAISEDKPINEVKQPISEDKPISEDEKISETEVHAKRGVPEVVHGGTNGLHDHLEGYVNLSYVA
ncbi:neurofilament heavy polypeptide-like [Penaeus vannamei]|uniref:neurofilament heavy polypeptide-like n=1 Tax=Penaeus vannamei TaxID=6689 RepID=UPI00387F7DEF